MAMLDDVDGGISRREALRRLGVGGSLLTLPGLLAACGGGGSGSGARNAAVSGQGSNAEIESISWGLLGSLLTIDAATGGSADGWMTQALGLEGLLYLDGDFQLQPLLAESWESTGPLEHTFKLRQGVTFWDGSPLTAEDVAYTYARHLDPKVASHMAYYLINVKDVRAAGRDEVVLRLKEPDPFILYIVPLIHITQKAFSEKLGDRLGKPAGDKVTTMGTGPYRFTSFSAENGVTVERNEEYWGEKPRVLRATLKTVENAQTQLLAARSGEIDGLFGFDLQQSKQWERLRDVRPEYTPGMRTIYLCFNMEKAPFDDVHVRRAIVHAANRQGYVDAFLAGHAVAGGPTLTPQTQWTEPLATKEQTDEIYASLANFPYDIEAAKAELAQSSHPDGFSAEIEYPSYELAAGKALVSLSESLKEIGIDLRVKEVTLTKWAADIDNHINPGLFFMTGSAVYPDPMQFPLYSFDSEAARKGGYNLANYKNPEVDRLIAEQNRETDDAKRREIIVRIFELTSDAVAYMGMWFPDIALALNRDYVYEGFNCLYYANRGFLTSIRAAA